MKNIIVITLILTFWSVNAHAQKYEPRWVLSVEPAYNIALNGNETEAGGNIGCGLWLNRVTGFRISINGGYMMPDKKLDILRLGARLDWMLNLLKDYNKTSNFGLVSMAGISYNRYFMCDDYPRIMETNTIAVHASIQASYKITKHWAFVLEPGIIFIPKYYDRPRHEDTFVKQTLAAGLIYQFKL